MIKEIFTAREMLRTNSHDPDLIAFYLRSLPITMKAELTDLAWNMSEHGTTTKEVKWLIDEIEKRN